MSKTTVKETATTKEKSHKDSGSRAMKITGDAGKAKAEMRVQNSSDEDVSGGDQIYNNGSFAGDPY